jgi:hypothetical protein
LVKLRYILVAVPAVVVTERELLLANAIKNVFPMAFHIYCRWHGCQNIVRHASGLPGVHVDIEQTWQTIMKAMTELITMT